MFWKCINFHISKTAKTDTVWFDEGNFPKQYNKLEDFVMLCGISVKVFHSYCEKKCFKSKNKMCFMETFPQIIIQKYTNISKRLEDI